MTKINSQWFSVMIILILVVILVLQRSCTGPNIPPKPEIIRVTDTTWLEKDTIIYRDTPVPYRVEVPVEVPANVDTAAILKDYFAKYIYKDSIPIDTFGYVRLTDIITQNKIEKREYSLSYKLPTIRDSVTVIIPPTPRTQVYVGFNIMGNVQYPVSYFGPNIVLKTKKDQMYNLGIGMGVGGVTIGGGMAWKIKIK